jgi:hypothetical protein
MIIAVGQPTVCNFMKSWMTQAQQHNKEVQAFTRDVRIDQIKTFKAKVVHANNGSMRRRSTRYYFGRKNLDAVVKSTLLENVYPTGIEMDTNGEDDTGTVSVAVTFGFGDRFRA